MNSCHSLTAYHRRKTRQVLVGSVGIGGDNPIRIQSMTTSNTRDVEATILQAMKLADAGCEIVRMTVQGIKEAESCDAIKNGLVKRGYNIPLVADIHFYPPAAMKVVESVDKVRINPGNFVDKRAQFKQIEYDDASYQAEIDKIYEGFAPLVEKCKTYKKAIRIGTNHGSLSDRIMNRFGDTPAGMVESALEFARVARALDFHDMIFSMKASNPKVMIHAYRLLVAEMDKLGWDYPLHLGVTEAGEGEDGRIKSALGIGSLLLDGIGDTIRVSLTEDPWIEVDPCRRLVKLTESYQKHQQAISANTFSFASRKVESQEPLHFSGSVIVKIDEDDLRSETLLEDLGCSKMLNQIKKGHRTPEILLIEKTPKEPSALKKMQDLQKAGFAIVSRDPTLLGTILLIDPKQTPPNVPYAVEVDDGASIEDLKGKKPLFFFYHPKGQALYQGRSFYDRLCKNNISAPFIFAFSSSLSWDDIIIHASAQIGSLLCDGLAEGVALLTSDPIKERLSLSFGLLQAARLRSVKTEFISCPGCGRTLFELQSVSKRIKQKTSHLAGVKIAIMGCIVNGPGEMADADFGYVGSRPGKIDLYVGKQCVEKNIDFADADDRLIDLIKAHGRWVEPELV
jgi:(E)-4-hydroxy-3-methylbut-2-enyl-diphosphate synthase